MFLQKKIKTGLKREHNQKSVFPQEISEKLDLSDTTQLAQ